MRYQTNAVGEDTYLIGSFATGETVTIAIYDLSDGSSVALDSASCAEIGSTGWYRWGTDNITTPTTTLKHYLYVMTDSTGDTFAGKLVVGGYVDEIDAAVSSISGGLTVDENAQLMKALTTAKFLALK